MTSTPHMTRRRFLGAASAAVALPTFIPSSAFGANDRIVMGCIGMGKRGTGDMRSFLGFDDVHVAAVCDVVASKREKAKSHVDEKYGNTDCKAYNDFREIIARRDIDVVLIGTPDHWHVPISIMAMDAGKDVFCEKPETLTVREGRALVDAVDRLGRVFSGGSQRVWNDYNWFHRMVRGGAIGDVQEVWVHCGGPSKECYLPEQPVPEGLDWNLWLGPAPWAPFHSARLGFRGWRDYSGGGMTDWGAHCFGGAMFACGLEESGPVEVLPPDGKDVERLTVRFANGVRMYHNGGWDKRLSFRGTDGDAPLRDAKTGKAIGKRPEAPKIHIKNYGGSRGFFGDFIHCVKTRETPFRSAERAHRTCTVCHLANIAYWLKRRVRWNPETEQIIGDPQAARWLDRPRRAPWTV